MPILKYRSVPQIHPNPPPFAILALLQNAGGAYTRDVRISLVITPSLLVKHDLIVSGGWDQARDGEMLLTLVVG